MSLRSVSIDLEALQHNFKRVKDFAPNAKVTCVLKNNAYGHGLEKVAQTLSQADAFAVFDLNEAIALRSSGIKQKILVLSGFDSVEEIKLLSEYNLIGLLHQAEQINLLNKIKLKKTFDVRIKIDVGMHRLGFYVNEFESVVKKLNATQNVNIIGILSHLPCADDVNNPITSNQLTVLKSFVNQYKLDASVAHSPCVIAWPESHFHWVRPGVMLYGISPMLNQTAEALNLKPVMTLRSKLISIRNISAGEKIGYGGAWECPEDMRVGIVSIGYASGYPRHAKSGTPVSVSGNLCPLIGRVCMDMISVDLRQHPNAQIGDEVVLWGKGLPVENIAAHCDSIAYELVSGISL